MPFCSALLILIFFAITFLLVKSNIFTRFMKDFKYKFQWDNCHQYFTFIWDDEWYSYLQKRLMSHFYCSNYLILHFNLILVSTCWVPPSKASVKGCISFYVVRPIISSRLSLLISWGLSCKVQHGVEPQMLLKGSTTQRCWLWPQRQYSQGQDIALDIINSPSEQTQKALFCRVLYPFALF